MTMGAVDKVRNMGADLIVTVDNVVNKFHSIILRAPLYKDGSKITYYPYYIRSILILAKIFLSSDCRRYIFTTIFNRKYTSFKLFTWQLFKTV